MRKVLNMAIIALMVLSFSGCADRKTINDVTYDTYGYFNENTAKNPNIQYELSIGNVIWSVILIETIVMPIYFIGFSLFEPTGVKRSDDYLNGVVY